MRWLPGADTFLSMNEPIEPTTLRRLRQSRGLTLEGVVERLKIAGAKPASVASLSRWETGIDPIPRKVRGRLARILRCNVGQLTNP